MATDLGTLQLGVRARLDQLDDDLSDVRRRAARTGEQAGNELGEGMGERAASRFSAAKAGMAAAGAALGAVAAVGFKNALENEQANANFAASMGLEGEWAATAGKLAGEVYGDNFGDSLESVQGAMAALNAADLIDFGDDHDQLKQLTSEVLTLADVFEVDMPKAVNTLGVMLKQGLVKDGQEGVDLLTRGLQGVAPSLREDLLDSLNEYSVFWSQFGLSGSEAMAALVAASKGGAIAIDKVGDMMKEATIRFQDGSKTSVDALQALGHNAEDIGRAVAMGGETAQSAFIDVSQSLIAVEDPLKRTQLGVALFGTQFEDLGQDAVPTLAAMGAGMDKVEGAAKRMTDQVGATGAAKLETFRRGMEQNVTNVMGAAIGVIEKLPGPLQTVVSGFAGFMPMLAPLTPLFAAFIPMLLGTGAAAGGASVSLGAMAASLWAVMAPVLAVVAVIAGLIAIGYVLVQNWDTIQAAAGAVWGWIGDHIGTIVRVIIGATGIGLLILGGEQLIRHWDDVQAAAGAVWDWITGRVEGFVGFFTGIPGRIAAAASGMWDGIYNAFRSAVNSVIRAWNSLGIPGFSIDINLPGPIPDIHFSWGGMSLPNIPLLDTGGIVMQPTLAALSVNRKPEAIIPLDRLESMMGLGADERSSGGVRAGPTIIVQGSVVTERQLADLVRDRTGDVNRHNPTPRRFGRR